MSLNISPTSALSPSRKVMCRNTAQGGAVWHPALRPFVTTGVALVGASVIAVSTIAPALPGSRTAAIPVFSPAVQLTAAPSPLEFYPQVVGEALVNAGFLVWDYVTVGPALVAALVTDPVTVLQATAANVGFLFLLAPAFIFGAAAVIASPVTNGLNATLVALNDVGNAVAAGDVVDLINAIVNIPARIIDGVLNGGYPLPLGGTDNGLLNPAGTSPGPFAIPINFLAAIIGAAGIQFPFRPAPVGEPPILQAATVTLSTGPFVESGSPPADTGFAEADPKPAQAQDGLDTAVVKSGDDVDGLANAPAQAPDPADQGVDALREKTDDLANAPAQAPDPADQGVDAVREKTDDLANAPSQAPGQVTGGFIKTTTEASAGQDHELDAPTTERPAGGTDLTDGNTVQPGRSPSADPTARKTPLRDTFNKAGTDINKDVNDLSSNVKKALSGGKNGADNGHDANNGDNGKDGPR